MANAIGCICAYSIFALAFYFLLRATGCILSQEEKTEWYQRQVEKLVRENSVSSGEELADLIRQQFPKASRIAFKPRLEYQIRNEGRTFTVVVDNPEYD